MKNSYRLILLNTVTFKSTEYSITINKKDEKKSGSPFASIRIQNVSPHKHKHMTDKRSFATSEVLRKELKDLDLSLIHI